MIKLEQKYLSLLASADEADLQTRNLRLCFELLTVSSAIDRDCAVRLGKHHLSEGKFVIIILLHQNSSGLSPHELADRAGTTRATVTGLLDGLELQGLVNRTTIENDRRKLNIELSPKGKILARKLFKEHTQWIASLFSSLSHKEQQLLSSLLLRVWSGTNIGALPDSSFHADK